MNGFTPLPFTRNRVIVNCGRVWDGFWTVVVAAVAAAALHATGLHPALAVVGGLILGSLYVRLLNAFCMRPGAGDEADYRDMPFFMRRCASRMEG